MSDVETPSTGPTGPTGPLDPLADRYGRPSAGRRRAVVLGSGLVGLVALGWLAWVVVFQSTPDVQSSLQSFEVVDTHEVTAQVSVLPRDRDVVASCLLRAFARDHTVVGERNFAVRDTGERVRLTVSFRTEREATSVELVGCTAAGQNRPR